jgi:hypothetical protein
MRNRGGLTFSWCELTAARDFFLRAHPTDPLLFEAAAASPIARMWRGFWGDRTGVVGVTPAPPNVPFWIWVRFRAPATPRAVLNGAVTLPPAWEMVDEGFRRQAIRVPGDAYPEDVVVVAVRLVDAAMGEPQHAYRMRVDPFDA